MKNLLQQISLHKFIYIPSTLYTKGFQIFQEICGPCYIGNMFPLIFERGVSSGLIFGELNWKMTVLLDLNAI